jgi:membrane-bound lytic murein transglycosylase A
MSMPRISPELVLKFISGDLKIVGILTCILLLSSCALFKPKEPGIGKPVNWNDVDGWHDENHAEAWPALANNCIALANKTKWKSVCKAIKQIDNPDNAEARLFFETWFSPHALYGKGGREDGLVTGYYEPLLQGSLSPAGDYPYPLYREPDNLLTVSLGEMYPELKNKRIRGMLNGKKVVPFYSREQIEENRELLSGNEIIWIDDRDDVFFLHIQGSGRVRLEDGSMVGVGYSNQNGHPYVAIGRKLLEWEELDRDEISLFTIRQWLADNPQRAEGLLNENPSYVFFELREDTSAGPTGSLNVPLTPERSIAIDPKVVPLGTPVWLTTNIPGKPDQIYQRLVIAQDTGGAIRGPLRADLFWGHGNYAEQSAGVMKEMGTMLVLLPRDTKVLD